MGSVDVFQAARCGTRCYFQAAGYRRLRWGDMGDGLCGGGRRGADYKAADVQFHVNALCCTDWEGENVPGTPVCFYKLSKTDAP